MNSAGYVALVAAGGLVGSIAGRRSRPPPSSSGGHATAWEEVAWVPWHATRPAVGGM
jgi:hypothetical protein